MESILTEEEVTKIKVLWIGLGFLLGFVSMLISRSCFYLNIDKAETFVEEHYQSHIQLLDEEHHPLLKNMLIVCCADEVDHQQDAARRYIYTGWKGVAASIWTVIFVYASALFVQIAKQY